MTSHRALARAVVLALGVVALRLASIEAARALDPIVADFKRAWADATAEPETPPDDPPAKADKGQGGRNAKRPETADQIAERHAKAQLAALDKLAPAKSLDAAQALTQVLVDPRCHWKASAAALDLLTKMQEKPVHDWVAKALTSDPDTRLRCLLCTIVGGWGDDEATKALLPLVKDKQSAVIAAAVDVLGRFKKVAVVGGLVDGLKDAKDARAIDSITTVLRKLTGKELQDPGEWTAWWAAEKDQFSFDAPAAASSEPKPEATGGGLPKTTSDGSGLFDKVGSEHVCFLIDNSGSMQITGDVLDTAPAAGGAPGTHSKDGPNTPSDPKKKTVTRLEYVQRELVSVIDNQLSKKATFNVLAFASEVVPWQKKLVPADDSHRAAAKAWINALRPSTETNIYGALQAAFADKDVDTIYLLTDGFPDYGRYIATDSIVGEVKKWNLTRKVRIHCICYLVGDGTKFKVIENKSMSKTFMKTLADETGGTLKVFE